MRLENSAAVNLANVCSAREETVNVLDSQTIQGICWCNNISNEDILAKTDLKITHQQAAPLSDMLGCKCLKNGQESSQICLLWGVTGWKENRRQTNL